MTELAVAVRELVAFCHRTGDIDHRFTPSPTAREGIAGHQRVYASRPASYQREFTVSYQYLHADISLLLRGRADGYDPELAMVEEIKTCRVPFADIPESVAQQHMAQARIYAALIALQEEREQLEVRLTWFNIDSGQEFTQSCVYSAAELAAFLIQTLESFSRWLHTLAQLRVKRNQSIEELEFPHGSFRKGQREIAELVYKCVDQGGQLMVEAPTGIGKTAATLYPALKGLATGKHEGIQFVTARTVGRRAAEDCLTHFRESGLRINALSLTAKERICFSPGKACHAEDCRFAKGYYDRLPTALEEAIISPSLRRSEIEELAQAHTICPYQLADDLLPWVDVVIADQHYVYSLLPKLGAAINGDTKRWTVLLDEAHNLPERARNMYSAKLAKASVMKLKQQATGQVARALRGVNEALLVLQREEWQEEQFDSRQSLPEKLLGALHQFTGAVGEELAARPTLVQQQPLLIEFYFEVLQWLRVAECFEDDFRLELSRGSGKQSLVATLNCLDATRLLVERQQALHAVVVFSATLSPANWMRTLLGLGEDAVCRRVDSPFDAQQLQVSVTTQIDTRYRQRKASLGDLAGVIQNWLAQCKGNCITYFPSYRYMQDCLERLQLPMGLHLWQQGADQEEGAREELLHLLEVRRDVAAFCILGGVFGEGIDLPGDQLASVIVVGVGLPQVNRERQQLRQWYQQCYGAGFEFAYLYPGMQKVNQALGRVIRTHHDQGTALLIDNRYRQRDYRDLLPAQWSYEIE